MGKMWPTGNWFFNPQDMASARINRKTLSLEISPKMTDYEKEEEVKPHILRNKGNLTFAFYKVMNPRLVQHPSY